MKAIAVTTKGVIEEIDVKVTEFIADFKPYINGWYEIVRPRHKPLPEKFVMVVDEDGINKQLRYNLLGTKIYGNYIAGDIVFIREDNTPDGLDFVDSTDVEIAKLIAFLFKIGANQNVTVIPH